MLRSRLQKHKRSAGSETRRAGLDGVGGGQSPARPPKRWSSLALMQVTPVSRDPANVFPLRAVYGKNTAL